jgi:type IX secretion system PorP/SprF family membrane protein
MKNQLLKNLLMTSALLCCLQVMAQDIHFSQFYETPLYRNPALAGIVSGDVRVQTVYRNQWNSVANAYKTTSLNAEYKAPIGNADDYITLGAQVFYDKAGTAQLTTAQLLPALNYHKSISSEKNMYLSLGFMGGIVQRRFDRSKITTNSMYESRGDGESLTQTNFSHFDGSVGMSLNGGFGESNENNFILGAAYHHFNKPKNAFYLNSVISLKPKYVFSGAMKIGVGEVAYLNIQSDVSAQGNYKEVVAGMMYGMKIGDDYEKPDYVLHGGAFVRLNDAIIPTIKLDYAPFSVGLSYDVNISPLKSSSYGRGGFELSLSYIGFLDRDNSSMNAVKCPRY